ncbi:MAG: hypothetical protein O7D95_03045 [Betaproteobacteria bacterium]|nr:hypothetical protein [Betaproteobacteria bacterium]
MKLPTYKDALKMGKEKIGQLLVPVKVNRAKKQAELEMCKLEEEFATKEAELNEMCCDENIDFQKIIALQDKIGLIDRKKKQYVSILEQMFPEK